MALHADPSVWTLALLALLSLIHSGLALRTGAPSVACLTLRPLHGLNRAKPASASQFFVTQSALSYENNQTIRVDVATQSAERFFRGFLIQAYDPLKGSQIGHFEATEESRPISCSAATHRDSRQKQRISLLWVPPTKAHSQPEARSQENPISQWLNHIRQPVEVLPEVPEVNSTVTKRQLPIYEPMPLPGQPMLLQPPGPPMYGPPPATVVVPGYLPHANVPQPIAEPSPSEIHAAKTHQVRFRATVVVSYEEFYTGFESSDQSFAAFDFADGRAKKTL